MPSENVSSTVIAPDDRRTRKRRQRRDQLLELAAGLAAEGGVDAVTITALAEAADYAPASLYTYFPSRSALIAAVQRRALERLAAVAAGHLAVWDRELHLDATDAVVGPVEAVTRLWAFAELFLTAPRRYPHEFRLQQDLLVTPGVEDTEDAAEVVPAAMAVLDIPRRLLAAAREAGAFAQDDPPVDPLGDVLDLDIHRTLAWVVAMNGALLIDSLATGVASTGHALGREITSTFLRGWGAPPALVDDAARRAAALTFDAPMPITGGTPQ